MTVELIWVVVVREDCFVTSFLAMTMIKIKVEVIASEAKQSSNQSHIPIV